MALKMRMFKMTTLRCNKRFKKSEDDDQVDESKSTDRFTYGFNRVQIFNHVKEFSTAIDVEGLMEDTRNDAMNGYFAAYVYSSSIT